MGAEVLIREAESLRREYLYQTRNVINCRNCAAPLTINNGCEYCGTGMHKKSIPLSSSERTRIENEIRFKFAVPERGLFERIFDRIFL